MMSIFHEITAPNGKVSYIFGTAHASDEVFMMLPLVIETAFKQATTCVFEAPTPNKDPEAFVGLTLRLAQTWSEGTLSYLAQIPSTYVAEARLIFKATCDKSLEEHPELEDYFRQALDNILAVTPISIALPMITDAMQGLACHHSIDAKLMLDAERTGKSIAYLESIEEQWNAFMGYNLTILEQIEVFYFIKSESAKPRKTMSLDDFKQTYQQQDIQRIRDRLQFLPVTPDVPVSVRRYMNGILSDRDLKMADNMIQHLDGGDAFIAVGAGHLKGIIEQLNKKGYRVTPIDLQQHDGLVEIPEKQEAEVTPSDTRYRETFFKESSGHIEKKTTTETPTV